MLMKISDHDLIFLSYDEPNADQNYEDLCKKIPWAKRIHGVKGSDSAHKACAELSKTERFIIVDADNIVDEKFISEQIEIPDEVFESSVISWSAKNIINGLIYGNGGIKSWTRKIIFDMKTHENADDNIESQVDFCWNLHYYYQNKSFSVIHNNSTPFQAWRAGFREGVKLSLIDGRKPNREEFNNIHWKNKDRLAIWLTVGSDVDNGIWSILGARQGLYMLMCTDWNYIEVRDFDNLKSIWDKTNHNLINYEIEHYGKKIVESLKFNIPINYLDNQQSSFFKTVYKNVGRMTDTIIIG